jgi:hypothetical protein
VLNVLSLETIVPRYGRMIHWFVIPAYLRKTVLLRLMIIDWDNFLRMAVEHRDTDSRHSQVRYKFTSTIFIKYNLGTGKRTHSYITRIQNDVDLFYDQ